ncbi:hypothetical protein HYX16_06155 [Candidatus Woesearchaeota archaeon]|nr:hypothetical protein [Candidatus Woesearchaeota archaeon]
MVIDLRFGKGREDELKDLESFLSAKNIPLETVKERLGACRFETFFAELCKLKELLGMAKTTAGEGDLVKTGYILGAGAKVQKDRVYFALLDPENFFPILFNIQLYPHLDALKDYIVETYDKGVEECEKILKGSAE